MFDQSCLVFPRQLPSNRNKNSSHTHTVMYINNTQRFNFSKTLLSSGLNELDT